MPGIDEAVGMGGDWVDRGVVPGAALVVALILLAIGLPSFLRAYRSYQLSNAATEMADILRLARYEAIRLNKSVPCVVQASGSAPGYTNVWVDSNVDGNLDPTEKMFLLGPSGNLVDGSGVPGTSTLIAAATNGAPVTAPSPSSSSVMFDARGAVTPLFTVNVFYLSSALAPDAGFRAVFLMPAGSIQIWTSDVTGNWQQLR